jgi:hypothetical protein
MTSAVDYLLGPLDSTLGGGPLWRWVEGGRVVSWNDGPTIAYREELTQVLERLAPRGLPPFGAVLLLLSATRNSWSSESVALLKLRTWHNRQQGHVVRGLLGEVVQGLDRVNALPPELRISPAAKADLAELVFEDCRPTTAPQVTQDVLRLMRAGTVEVTLSLDSGASDQPPEAWFWHNLLCLDEGLQRVDLQRLTLRKQTGLEELPEPADIELPPGERVRGLLDRLEEDEELGGLVRLTRDLMAAVTLPRAVSEPDELPQGGVSDLTNRGPLDRLLLSELAHDDLTLAVRVATGAALYWRRERPPQPLPRQRSLLLESGLRSWGVPRVFSTAVALAVAATADRHTSLSCHRARGAGLAPVELTTRAGLIEHLAALEPEAHPGPALIAFAEAVQSSVVDTDALLVVSEDVYSDSEFQRELGRAGLSPLLVATVRRDGRLALLARSERGCRVLREVQLDLRKLFQPSLPKQKPLIEPARRLDGPAILSVKQFPLRLSHHIDSKRMARVEGVGILAFLRDRRLLLWDLSGHGARQISDQLPRGALLWCCTDLIHGWILAVVGDLSSARLTLLKIHLDRSEFEAIPLQVRQRSYRGVCYHNGSLFAIGGSNVERFEPFTGHLFDILALGSRTWARDRFFFDHDAKCYVALSSSGVPGSVFVKIPFDREAPFGISAIFDCPGVEGPQVLRSDGSLLDTTAVRVRSVWRDVNVPVQVEAIARRGNRIVLSGKSGAGDQTTRRCVDVATGQVEGAYSSSLGDAVRCVERFDQYVVPVTLRNRFISIFRDDGGALVLWSRSGRALAIVHDQHRASIVLEDRGSAWVPRERVPYLNFVPDGSSDHRLRVATWPDGSRALLDRRGLLHLQSADRSIPEVSIVLKDGMLAGWCADGTLWGPPYITGVRYQVDAIRHVWDTAIGPFVRRLP